jgi:hypothetical protein
MDICYAPSNMYNKWYEAGWIRNIEDMVPRKIGDVEVTYGWEDVKKDLPKGIFEAQQAGKDGKMIGIPYFCSSIGNLTTYELLLEKGGYADTKTKTDFYPKTYQELYEQCEAMKKKGVAKHPWLPRWGVAWYGFFSFFWESMARGDDLFDKEWNPTFDVNTPVAEMLKDWQYLYEKEICPRGVLATDEGENISWFMTGEYAYSEHHPYEIMRFQDPSVSKIAGYASVAPPQGDRSPVGFLFAPIYCIRNNPPSKAPPDWRLARVHRLMQFMGYKDKEGKFYRHKYWQIQAAVASPYAAVYQDPEVVDAFSKWVYRPQDLDTMWELLQMARMPGVWKAPWGMDWTNYMNTICPQVIQGSMTVNDGIGKLRAKAEEYIQKYKV